LLGEFFSWQALVEGRYELVDGHIVPHPDYVTPAGFAAPDAEHGLVCLNLGIALQAQLQAPCRALMPAWASLSIAEMPTSRTSPSHATRATARGRH